MSEAKPELVTFKFQELAEILVKQQGIHDGIWGLYMEFGIAGSNVGANENELVPAAIVPVLKLGIQRFPSANGLTVDAAKVNPPGAPLVARLKKLASAVPLKASSAPKRTRRPKA